MQAIVTYRKTRRLSMRIGKDGEVRVSVPYGVPKADVEKFIDDHRAWIGKAQVRAVERQRKRADFFAKLPLSTRRERGEAVTKLNVIVAPMVERYAAQMGVSPSAITYRATVSRWGCCKLKTKEIQFSLYLLLLPGWCIEGVVVHELAHLIVPNHGPKFYAVLDRHFPLWRDARRTIRSVTF